MNVSTVIAKHSHGPFYVTDETVIASEDERDGDIECDDRRRNWIAEFYGANKEADAAFAARAMNAHQALTEALKRALALLECEKASDDKECARVGLKPCETLASAIAQARAALAAAK
jgi:hypothetical protein